MTDNIYTYFIKMPDTIRECVLPCLDGYTIYINEALTQEQKEKAYAHAMKHIDNNDCYNECDINHIEKIRH